MITSFGLALISEDCVADNMPYQKRHVLNQWTYQARLYSAARYVVTQPDMQLVQLVSFGCGIDAITGDETREIIESGGKLYKMCIRDSSLSCAILAAVLRHKPPKCSV